jgi:hypothetical protein
MMTPLLYRLTATHRRLDDQIRLELSKRFPDFIRLLRLKRLKLAVKDCLHGHVPMPGRA